MKVKNKKAPIRIGMIIGKWVGGGVEAVVAEEENDEPYDYNDDIDDDPTSYEEYEKIYEEKRKKKEILEKIRLEDEKIDKEKRKAWSRKNKKKILIGLVSFFIIAFILTILIVSKNLIQVGYSPDKLIGLKYDLVEEKL